MWRGTPREWTRVLDNGEQIPYHKGPAVAMQALGTRDSRLQVAKGRKFGSSFEKHRLVGLRLRRPHNC